MRLRCRGWPLYSLDFGSIKKIYVPGRLWADREHWMRRDEIPMATTKYWFSPQLERLAEFRSECEAFERDVNGWRAARDGYEYAIPERWGLRTETREWW